MLTTVPAHSTGDVFPASDWNTYLENNINYLITAAQTGWRDLSGYGTFTYNSADGPTFVMNSPVDLTGIIGLGCRIKLTQTTVKYFIVTAIAAGTITLYGGTDYTLANAAISAPSYSQDKAPLGFPLDAAKWTETTKDTSDRTQASPTQNTWYNTGSILLNVPIGAWRIGWGAPISCAGTSTVSATLSTANNSESDSELSSQIVAQQSAGFVLLEVNMTRDKNLAVAAKTPYYLNIRTIDNGVTQIAIQGTKNPTIIRAICAYL